MAMIDPVELRKYLHYCPDTGIIVRKISTSRNTKVGDVAGTFLKTKGSTYILIALLTRYYLAHRAAWAIMKGEWPDGDIDHIDGNGLNNRWDNLRSVSHEINCRNQKLRNTNTSGVVGVDFVNGRWRARIGVSGKTKHIGFYDDKNDAINARLNYSKIHEYHENHGTSR